MEDTVKFPPVTRCFPNIFPYGRGGLGMLEYLGNVDMEVKAKTRYDLIQNVPV